VQGNLEELPASAFLILPSPTMPVAPVRPATRTSAGGVTPVPASSRGCSARHPDMISRLDRAKDSTKDNAGQKLARGSNDSVPNPVLDFLAEIGMANFSSKVLVRGFDTMEKLRLIREADMASLGLSRSQRIKLRSCLRQGSAHQTHCFVPPSRTNVSPSSISAATRRPLLLGSRQVQAGKPAASKVPCVARTSNSTSPVQMACRSPGVPTVGLPSVEQVTAVQKSWVRVKALGYDNMGELVYRELFRQAPVARAFFPLDVRVKYQSWELDEAEVGEDLMNSPALKHLFGKIILLVGECVSGLRDPSSLMPKLKEKGMTHVSYGAGGIEQAHFEIVGNVLIETLRKCIGEEFTPEVEFAWTTTYKFFAAIMWSGLTEAREIALHASTKAKALEHDSSLGSGACSPTSTTASTIGRAVSTSSSFRTSSQR